MSKKKEMVGKTFGRLTVIASAPAPKTTKSKEQHWLCSCMCGNRVVVRGSKLRNGCTKSCGCLHKERLSQALKNRNYKKHGMTHTRLYRIYMHMKQRCYNPNNTGYSGYGGRGIKICPEWLDKENGFTNFYNWATSHGYADNLSIDRINVDGNYEPPNCRWANASIQGFNQRIKSNNTSGHTGVSKYYNGKYVAYIKKDGKIIKLGYHNTFEEAVEARERAEKELYPTN